jgi:hypothetical protein
MSQNSHLALALAIALGAGAPLATAQSLTTTFTGTTQSIGNGAGAFFDVTALNASGIVVNSFDVNLGATVGTAVPVHVYYRPGTYAGFEQNIAEWRYLGHFIATAAGVGSPTPVAIGGVHIRQNETIGFRVGVGSSNHRYNTELTTVPVHANDDVQINLGTAQNNFFFSNTAFPNRGWNGTIYYSVGASVDDGACCLPDGTCIEGRAELCAIRGGVYQGDATVCASVMCLPPAPGACCLPGDVCSLELADTCRVLGGIFHGENTTCDTFSCGRLDAFTNTITTTVGQYAGNFFDVTAMTNLDVEITGWDLNTSSSAGTNLSVRVYYKPGTWEGFHGDVSAWTFLGEIPVVAAGPGNPTRVNIGGLRILAGQTYGIRMGPSVGSLRYATTFTDPVSTDHLTLTRGAAQGVLFSPASLSINRGWQGVIHYRLLGAPANCYANCDGSTVEPVLNVDDFTCFINEYAQAQTLPHEQQVAAYANCDGSTVSPALNVDDFTCFINQYAQGCP